jgi:hypothetical protein
MGMGVYAGMSVYANVSGNRPFNFVILSEASVMY